MTLYDSMMFWLAKGLLYFAVGTFLLIGLWLLCRLGLAYRWLTGLHHWRGYQWQFAWPHKPSWHETVDASYPGVLLKHRTLCIWIVQVRWVTVALLPRGVPTPIRNRQAWGPDGSNADALPPRIDSRDRA